MVKRVRLVPLSGLGNRMRAIASSIAVVKKYSVPMDIYWHREPGFNAPFLSLFEKITLPGISFHDYSIKDLFRYNIPRKLNFHLPEFLRKSNQEIFISNECGFLEDKILNSGAGEIILATGGEQTEFYSIRDLFSPVQEIENIIESVGRDFPEKTVGCHIRRTDNDLSVKISSNDKFYKVLDELFISDDSVKVFLCSDDVELKEKFRNKYGDKIITYKSVIDRNKKTGIRDAVIEMFLLSQTNYILGSYWSSFSEVSAVLGGKELKIVK